MGINLIYMPAQTFNSETRRAVIQKVFPDHNNWTWKNFVIVFAGDVITLSDGKTTSWDEDYITVVI